MSSSDGNAFVVESSSSSDSDEIISIQKKNVVKYYEKSSKLNELL